MKTFKIYASFALAGLVACGDGSKPEFTDVSPHVVVEPEASRVVGPSTPELISGFINLEDLHQRELIRSVYGTRNYAPIWSNSDGLEEHGESVLAVLLDAETVHGLWEEDYAIGQILELVKTPTAPNLAKLDVLLTDSLARFAYDLRYSNPVWEESLEDDLKRITNDPSQVFGWLRDLPPHFDQYALLTTAWQQYSDIVSAGGWEALSEDLTNLRSSGPLVPALKERLRREGYWDEENSEAFGPKLRAAIIEYQRTHQLLQDGWITPETFRSLNVSAEQRRNQIRLSLQRWRESQIGSVDTFIHVNIPDFHAELWFEGQRELRFRVVTGATRTRWDKDRKEHVLASATPLIASTLEHLVFNPNWNVPQGIRFRELEPKIAEDPDYLETYGFEYVTEGQRTYLRQNPGPKNALGQVKFMFPNDHDVYLHDTPDKHFFELPVRAFSHGCIRVENPLELAEFLIARSSPWPTDKINEWLERPTETWIRLTRPIPVHIEYIVVRVDESGKANFLADVYGWDRSRLEEMATR